MPVEIRPAIPVTLPRTNRIRAGRERLLRWCATTITALVATAAIVVVAIVAVVLGIT